MYVTNEQREIIRNLMKNSASFEQVCERCPYAQACEQHELYWGCPAWEEDMGEDI